MLRINFPQGQKKKKSYFRISTLLLWESSLPPASSCCPWGRRVFARVSSASPLTPAPGPATCGEPTLPRCATSRGRESEGWGPAGPSPPSEGWGGPRAGVVASPPFSPRVLISGIDRKLQGQLNALRYRVLVRPERLQTAPQSLGGLRRRGDLWPALTPKSAEGNPCRRGGSAAPPPRGPHPHPPCWREGRVLAIQNTHQTHTHSRP